MPRLLHIAVWLVCFSPIALAQYPRVPDAWWHSPAGIVDSVLPPWTSVTVRSQGTSAGESMDVGVWGRTYTFRSSPLPDTIRTGDSFLLAAPVTIAGKLNGREIAWRQRVSPVVLEQTAARVTLRTSLADSSLRMDASTSIEYDGLVRCDLRIYSTERLSVASLRCDIPVRPALATLRTWWPNPFATVDNAGSIPPAGEKLPFKPYYWLGNEECGLAWAAESDRDWRPRYPTEALELIKTPAATLLRLHLVDRSLPLQANPPPGTGTDTLHFSFALQATPVKSFPRNWHSWHIDHGAFFGAETLRVGGGRTFLKELADEGVTTLVFHENWTDVQNYPLTTHLAELKRLAAGCHAQGITLLVYFGYEMSTIAPEWEEKSEGVLVRPRIGGYKRSPEQTDYCVCYRSDYANMLAAGISRLLADASIDGVYLDSTIMPWGCTNTDHGCGYLGPEGTIRPTYPIFAVRDFLRRLYVLCTRKPGGMVNCHASASVISTGLAYATSYWDGEQLVPNADKYTTSHLPTILPPDVFRTEFMGRNIGVPAEFLVYAIPKPYTWADGMAYALLHDVPTRPSGNGPSLGLIAPVWKAWSRFDIDNAVLHPYWRTDSAVISPTPGILITTYEHPRNGRLATVVNVGRDTATALLRLDFRRLHLSPSRMQILDAISERPVPFAGGTLEFPLGPLGMKLLWIR
jgi:hypothetical protein